jgi:signal transduction histidine kinase
MDCIGNAKEGVVMISPENKLFCRLDQMPGSEREQQRLKTLEELGLLETESVPIFEEATQTAAHFLDAPICILGLLDRERQWFKSAVGLSRIGLMNNLASSRQLSREESFCTHVVDSQQVLVVSDATNHPIFANSVLVQRYGIQAYLGVPLMAANGHCLGTLAIMSLSPRQFTDREIEFLELTSRWSMGEFERDRLLKLQQTSRANSSVASLATASPTTIKKLAAASVKGNLIAQMTQELCTPLTSILGMASVLSQGIYGTLTDKQKEYIEIIHNSGQYLLSLVNEIVELGALNDGPSELTLSPVDVEMLCQQAIAILNRAAQRRDQQIQLTVEPGPRVWLLDKDKVRHMLYHLVFSVIESSSSDSIIRIHVSRKQTYLNLTIWTSHPWLGDGLPQTDFSSNHVLNHFAAVNAEDSRSDRLSASDYGAYPDFSDYASYSEKPTLPDLTDALKVDGSRQSLGLLLSRQLAEMHNGHIMIQGSAEEGYRYVIRLPQIQEGASRE